MHGDPYEAENKGIESVNQEISGTTDAPGSGFSGPKDPGERKGKHNRKTRKVIRRLG